VLRRTHALVVCAPYIANVWSDKAVGRNSAAYCAVLDREIANGGLRFANPPYGLLLDLAAGLDPILEAAEIVDLLVAHFLEQLAGKRGAAA
jgi:hypothetical protein